MTIDKKANVVLRLSDQLPRISADPSQIQQLVMNLIINAAEALEGQPGTVEIGTSVATAEDAACSRSFGGSDLAPGNYVKLEVRDTGCGMAPETVSKMFDPFFTTKFLGVV